MNIVRNPATNFNLAFSLEKLSRNGGLEIKAFYDSHPSDFSHEMTIQYCDDAAKRDAVTVLRDWQGNICAAAIAFKHNSRFREIGSVLNTVDGSVSLMEVLIAFQVVEWAMRKEDTSLVCDVHDENLLSTRLFTENLGFSKWEPVNEDFIQLKKGTIAKEAPDSANRPVSYYIFDKNRLHRVLNSINHGADRVFRYTEDGSQAMIDTTKHPSSRLIPNLSAA